MSLYTLGIFVSRLSETFVLGLFDSKGVWRFIFRYAMYVFRDLRDCATKVIMMVDYTKLLQESKDMKFQAIASKKDLKHNPYSCNYSPVSHHKYCEHEHCIFDEDWIREDAKNTMIRNKLHDEENYLKYGEGTVGYDCVEVYKNVLKLKRQLKNLGR